MSTQHTRLYFFTQTFLDLFLKKVHFSDQLIILLDNDLNEKKLRKFYAWFNPRNHSLIASFRHELVSQNGCKNRFLKKPDL